MNQQDILKLAKQGDVKAITILLNSRLQTKGIIAKIAQKEDCLQIILESAEVPNQESIVPLIRQGLTSLKPESITRIKIYARETEASLIVWSEKFSLTNTEEPKTPNFSPAMSIDSSEKIKKEARTAEIQLGIVFWGLLFLFGSCTIYTGGYPWTCQQAQDAVKEAKKDLDNAFSKAEEGKLDDNSLYRYNYIVSNKEGIRDRKCSN